jgi:hypothetical protein
MNYPKISTVEKTNIEKRTPIRSISIPPKNGRIMFGSEYTE